MTIVKICGITDVASGIVAIDAGADYLGFVFYPPSSRALDPLGATHLISALRVARPVKADGWKAVGVFVNEPLELVNRVRRVCALDVVQLNGEETAEYVAGLRAPVFKAMKYAGANARPVEAQTLGAERILLDANVPGRYGGTGMTYDWGAVREAVAHGFLAGGLTPGNVAEAIRIARPWGVDVSSGVERAGAKDPNLIAEFLKAVRDTDSDLDGSPASVPKTTHAAVATP